MPNALDMGQPPVPNPDQQQPAAQGQPQANALGGPQGAPPQQQAAPAPTHVQTVAALAHFHAIQQELETLAKNPDLGKASIKSAIIDGTAKLVSQRIISPAEAVSQLSKVPEKPLEQKQWLEALMMQTFQASSAVLSHRQGAVASGTAPPEDPNAAYSADDHMSHMGGLAAHYNGLKGRG
jgi:hypothetical protein